MIFFKVVTGKQATDDRFMLRLSRVTSTKESKILTGSSRYGRQRDNAIASEKLIDARRLRQRDTVRPEATLDKLVSILLIRLLGGGRVVETLQLIRINELQTVAILGKFHWYAERVDTIIKVHCFALDFDFDFEVSLATRKSALLNVLENEDQQDYYFTILTAPVNE